MEEKPRLYHPPPDPPTRDAATRKDLERMKNRMLDFNPEVQAAIADTDTGIKGVDNAQIFLSGGVYQFGLRINGVPFHVAMTSAV